MRKTGAYVPQEDVHSAELDRLRAQLAELQADAENLCIERESELQLIPEPRRSSARNLLHYLSLRRQDIRPLQMELARWGLSSLGRLEAHVMAGLSSVANALAGLLGRQDNRGHAALLQDFEAGDARLQAHTTQLFGEPQREHSVRVMVTLGTEAAHDNVLVEQLVQAGMDVARINTAHDDPAVWDSMIKNVRAAAQKAGLHCAVLMDLAGPKLRTGLMTPGPRVLHIRVKRDERGFVRVPTVVHLVASTCPDGERLEPALPLPVLLLDQLERGDVLEFDDTAGRHRKLVVIERKPVGLLAHARQGCFVETGLQVVAKRDGNVLASGLVGDVPPTQTPLTLSTGDRLTLVGPQQLGEPAHRKDDGTVTRWARLPCTLPQVFSEVVCNDRIFFDDGKIAGVVRESLSDSLQVEIVKTPPGGAKLGADKGINLPDTITSLPALSTEDLQHLDFAVGRADIIGMSFVRTVQDIEQLHRELNKRSAGPLGVILKIETKLGFENLPQLLLAGLRRPPLGVMVARGDLGVELGFERMAEVQEQMLWLCEAAHVPVVWATEVLDALNKKGAPTRSEVTDAAMGARAECVMLNKGPYVVETVKFLVDILTRMQGHTQKKTPMLRKLKVSEER